MDDLKHRMKEWWEYDPGHLIPQAAARIEALEARVAAADALADALSFYADATVEYPNGTVTFQPGDDNGQRAKAALAAYQATKEQEQ